MSKVIELFGYSTKKENDNWEQIIQEQKCPFLGKTCYKVRKSDPDISIGTCTVVHGKKQNPIIICPTRLTAKRHIFTDCLHLLTTHEPGNELHIVSEVSVPGGSVDYFLVSAKKRKVKDFVGIELQTLDTTGTVWPERQRLLKKLGVERNDMAEESQKSFGMNWKMTAKTILVQMHHKIPTFEYVNKKLVLVVQDKLLNYMKREFNFGHLENPAKIGDSMHFHVYSINEEEEKTYEISMESRFSTDADGIGKCLGLQTEAKIELEQILESLESRLSTNTLFTPV
ncbi:MAG: NotI family restriction endonuclease [Xenococcaceae cyanobacterium MO_207.B15]|nr:NotI family restriction endonuclease [Xenococcaceae cyanobacterium MO_207.B15]